MADLVDVTRMLTADPGAPGAAPRLPARPPGEGSDPADRRGGNLVLPAHAGGRTGRACSPTSRASSPTSASPSTRWCRRSRRGRKQVDIIMLTHLRHEKNINAAMARIETLPPCWARSRASGWKSCFDELTSRTRGRRAPAARFSDVLLGGLAADGGLFVPQAIPQADARGLARGCPIPNWPSRSSPLHGRHSRTCEALVDRTYRGRFSVPRDITPLHDAGAGAAHPRTVQRPDAGVQGHRHAAARQPFRVRAEAGRAGR